MLNQSQLDFFSKLITNNDGKMNKRFEFLLNKFKDEKNIE